MSRDIDAVTDPAARSLFEQQARVLEDRYSVSTTIAFPVSDYFLELWPRYKAMRAFEAARALGVEAERERAALSAREAYYAFARAPRGRAHRRPGQLEHGPGFCNMEPRKCSFSIGFIRYFIMPQGIMKP